MPSHIQTMMLRIPGNVDLGGTLCRAPMPEDWDRLFKNTWPSPNERGGTRVPYASLGDSLRLLFPGIAHVERMNRDVTRSDWLFAWEQPGSDQFMALMKAWVRTEGRDRETDVTIDGLRREDLCWSRQELRFGEHDFHDNGSPRLDSTAYNLLPDLACAELAGCEIVVGDRPLAFRRAYDGRRPCLISWPPIESSLNESSSYWSYVLTSRILTFPGCEDPLLSFSASVRRWASKSLKRSSGYYNLPPAEHTTAYVEVPSPWYAGSSHDRGHSLVGLRMRLKAYENDGGREWKPAWVNSVDRILNRAAAEPRLPNAVEVAGDPERFLNRELGSTGITLRNSDTSHPVTEGVPLSDRRDLFQGISVLLQPYGFTPNEVSRRVPVRVEEVSPLRGLKYSDMPGSEVARSIQRSIGDRLRFEVWYQAESARDALRGEIWQRMLKGSSDRSPRSHSMTIDGIDIEISSRRLGALGSPLDASGRAGEDKRVEEIGREVQVADAPIASLVELHGADHFGGSVNRDPKAAIRRGLAARGRLSQFIVPLSGEEQGGGERVSNAVGDLLRQLGNLPGNPFDRMSSRSEFPADLQVLALWVHRKNGLPVLLHMASPSQISEHLEPIRIMLPTGRAGGEWHSYPEALLRIGAGEVADVPRDKVRGVLKMMLNEFSESQSTGEVPLLMLCDAQNMRLSFSWPELQNQKLRVGQTYKGPWNTAGLNARLARINVNDDELPQWFGSIPGQDDSLPWSSGLFAAPNGNAYFSVAPKSTTMKSGSHKRSKREQPFDNHALTRAKEIVLVQLREGDRPDEWANAIHRLRQMASHFNDPLERPLPLHLARQTEEYVPTYGRRETRTRRK